jgi:ppGpp synthetase/RelA/SpoT-type nucleotidyltranferase
MTNSTTTTTTTTAATTSRPRPTRTGSLKRALQTVALITAYNVTPSDCFTTIAEPKTATSSSSSTRQYFTVDETILQTSNDFYNPLLSLSTSSSTGTATTTTTHGASTLSASTSTSTSASLSSSKLLPTWLRSQKSHLVHENMNLLREAMVQSFFTENEVSKLTDAIQKATNGDSHKMAGAAEFCLIMVETMEMGLNALVAAAFHYCHCVAARERSLLSSDLSPWKIDTHSQTQEGMGMGMGIEAFGQDAVQMERDAARLKRLEMVASTVVINSNNSHRVSPDAEGAENLRNLFLTESKDWRALAIRGAACLYRLRGILKSNNSVTNNNKVTKESGRVCREALRIYAPIASRLGMHRLKNELEAAAFRILYRRQYETVTALLHQTRDADNLHLVRRPELDQPKPKREPNNHDDSHETDVGGKMKQILEQVQGEMTDLLQNDPEFASIVKDFTVTARVKESYSTWKKMLRDRFDHILQVPDALALRIVLNANKESQDEADEVTRAREIALSYYAQKLCMEKWAPHKDDARFKDYIAQPKANGYQSLHYTANTNWHGEEWSMEIQVRSGEMHKVAEFGVASHWDYKARAKPAKRDEEMYDVTVTINEHFGRFAVEHSDAYLRSLQEWHWQQHGGGSGKDAGLSSDEAESQLRAERIRARTQRLAPYIEALTAAQSDMQREIVFVFVHQSEESTEGTVVALPAGAVVLDAIRYCELPAVPDEDITHNGSPASWLTRLNNGDVLSIPSITACVTPTF